MAPKSASSKSKASSNTAAKKSTSKTAAKKAATKGSAEKASTKSSAKKSPAGKTSSKKSTSERKYSPAAGKNVEREMREMKQGKLKSGGNGKKVTNPKQAIAIGLSEARRAGKKVPPNPNK